MNKKKEKLRAQVKSRWYYIFWGTATVAVCAGQILVGSGFRRMAESFEKVLDAPLVIDFGMPYRRHPMMLPDHEYQHEYDEYDEDGRWYPTDPPQRI